MKPRMLEDHTKRVGILYICTGKYSVFWKGFFDSAENNLLTKGSCQKEYFVFSDADDLAYLDNPRVHRVAVEALPWPEATLFRFQMFCGIYDDLSKMDYLYFFNANMKFVSEVGEEILPARGRPLVVARHPGYFGKSRSTYPYCTNHDSRASVAGNEGSGYFMGALNGGEAQAYLQMVVSLSKNIDSDYAQGIIADWHDESHLNRYAIDHEAELTVLGPEYACPEHRPVSENPKVLLLDKRNHGGHRYLRNMPVNQVPLWKRLLQRLRPRG